MDIGTENLEYMLQTLDAKQNSRMWVPSHQAHRGGFAYQYQYRRRISVCIKKSVISSLEAEVILREEIIFDA